MSSPEFSANDCTHMARALQLAARGQALHGDHMTEIELVEEGDAGVEDLVSKRVSVQAADQHGARSTVARGADHFGAAESKPPTQEIGEGFEGRRALHSVAEAVDV